MMNTIQNYVNGFGFGISVNELASKIYFKLASLGYDPCIVNDRYIEVDGITYQLRKTRSKGHWTVVEI